MVERVSMVSPEFMGLIDEALAELASRDLPQVWVVNADGTMLASRIYWRTISDAETVLGYQLLPPLASRELAAERIHVINAKMGRVVAEVNAANAPRAVVKKLSRDERFFRVRESLVGVFVKHELTPDVLPHLQGFFQHAEKRPARYFVFATDEVMSVLEELGDENELEDEARFPAQ